MKMGGFCCINSYTLVFWSGSWPLILSGNNEAADINICKVSSVGLAKQECTSSSVIPSHTWENNLGFCCHAWSTHCHGSGKLHSMLEVKWGWKLDQYEWLIRQKFLLQKSSDRSTDHHVIKNTLVPLIWTLPSCKGSILYLGHSLNSRLS